ncbi:MAG: hypothetical protein ACJ746_27095 [Bryobacteraceae bacterium]
MTDFGARIDLQSFVCHLATTDLAPPKVRLSNWTHFESMTDLGRRMLGGKLNLLATVPDEIYEGAGDQLFHERLHYWQLIGYPVFQWRFVYSLERLRYRLFLQNAKTYVVAGLTTGHRASPKEPVERAIAILDSVVRTHPASLVEETRVEVTPNLCELEIGLIKPATSYSLPHANVLIRCVDGTVARIPLDAVHLLESAVSVTEVISGIRKLPSDETMVSADTLHYWGCWVYWREMLSASGLDTKRLMYVFLAAVDLAMMGDVGSLLDTDEASISEDPATSLDKFQRELSPSMRFLHICKVSRVDLKNVLSKEPFDRITGEFKSSDPDALYQLQGVMAAACKMSLPIDVAGRDLLRHTLQLGKFLLSSDGSDSRTPGQQAVYELCNMPLAAWRNAISVCETIWQEIHQRRVEETMEFIGYKVWSVMKNFTESRCRQPAAHASPSYYLTLLRNRFPLPFVNFGGYFFAEREGIDDEKLLSMHLPGPKVAVDLIELLPLLGVSAGDSHSACGFIDHDVASCDYAVFGLGCPVIGLTPKQTARREERNLGNYCHLAFSESKTGLRP